MKNLASCGENTYYAGISAILAWGTLYMLGTCLASVTLLLYSIGMSVLHRALSYHVYM